MLQIQGITTDTLQRQSIVLPDNTAFTMTLYFIPMQYSWVIQNFAYDTFNITNLKISNNPNILRQWKNILPFGLACFSVGNREPQLQTDFSLGNSILYVLSASEVAQYEAYLETA